MTPTTPTPADDGPAARRRVTTSPARAVRVTRVGGERRRARTDRVAVEEPLELRVTVGTAGANSTVTLMTTMRTPADAHGTQDHALAVGWLLSEGVLHPDRVVPVEQVRTMRHCMRDEAGVLTGEQRHNVLDVALEGVRVEDLPAPRQQVASASCGICGGDVLEDLAARALPPVPPTVASDTDLLAALELLDGGQGLFAETGGVHGAALVTPAGGGWRLLAAAEDVGRHNAVDKAVGRLALDVGHETDARTLRDATVGGVLLLSGRVGYELAVKAAVAGVGAIVAIGAPTSLAIDVCDRFRIRLLAFARGGEANRYDRGPDRPGV